MRCRDGGAGEVTRSRILPYLILIAALSLADWALTWDALQAGWAHELNPVGRAMMDQGIGMSLFLKMLIILPACAALYIVGTRRWVYRTTMAVAFVHVALVVWHCVGRLAF